MASRLYYPPKDKATLASGEETAASAAGEAAKKIAKLIPTELVTAYGALVGASLAIRWANLRLPGVAICFVICWVLTPVYLNLVADKDGKPKRNQIIVGTLAFPIWAYLVSGNQVMPDYYDAAMATIIATIFSLISGIIPMNK
jgi:hypothetical protein